MSYPLWLQCYSDLCRVCLRFQSEAWVMALPAVYFSRPLVCYLGWNPCIHCLALVSGIHIQLDGLFLLRSFLFMVSLTLSSSAGSSVYKACLVSLLRFILPATVSDTERKKTKGFPPCSWDCGSSGQRGSFLYLGVLSSCLFGCCHYCRWCSGVVWRLGWKRMVKTKSQGIIPFFLICKGSVACSLD